MKNTAKEKISRIAIRTEASAEQIIALAPTVAALKKKHRGASVGIVSEERLREASLLIPELDFFSSDPENVHADLGIDLTGAESGTGSAEDPEWKAYLQGVAHGPDGNPFHLVDLLRKCAGVESVDVNFELALGEQFDPLPEALFRPGCVRIAVCVSSLSASELQAVVEGISSLEGGAELFLLGTVRDCGPAKEACTRWDGRLSIHDLCGRQGLSANAAVLRACDIVVAGPGVHALIASAFGTFTIAVDGTPARGPLLYPYGHGHLVVQKARSEELPPSLGGFVADCIRFAMHANSGNVPSLNQWQQFADDAIFTRLGKLRLLATQRIEIVFRESGSFTELYLRPLLFTGSELFEVLHTFYRLLWEHSLSARTITSYDIELLHQDTAAELTSLLKPLEQLYELGNFGKLYSEYVRESLENGAIEKARHESERLREVEELLAAICGANPAVSPLFAFHRRRQQLLADDNPIRLAKEMAALFSGLQNRVLVLLDLTRSLFHTVIDSESPLEAQMHKEGNPNG